ncbi:DUF6630 family protein [Budvicia diplopodorum]|uniref:DUF6630 family protein n=1 Tax=Budvicia diplopodorum TaxID=1119056 RepID=UPI00135C891E|nr:hypothetical protein [Budvicia diplopodorum]
MSVENITLLAQMIVTDGNNGWPDIYHKAISSPEELLNSSQYKKYDFGRYLDNVYAGGLIDLLYCYTYQDGFIDMVDWRGEDDDGQIANFVVRRIAAFRPDINLGVCLNELEQRIQRDELREKEVAAGDYVLHQFTEVTEYLKPMGLSFGCINIGWDSYLIFVTTQENMAVLQAIDDHHFTISAF